MLAPLALFVYKRPKHTAHTLEYLSRNSEFIDTPVYIFCDGPKKDADLELVHETRAVARNYSIDNVHIVEREHNLGLAASIIKGVTSVCDQYGKVIVLEDDMLVSSGFLSYMNRALSQYGAAQKVMQISGHVFPFEKVSTSDDAFFMPITSTSGWATWQRAWQQFDIKATGYEELSHNKVLRKQFDLNGCYPYSKMMFNCMAGKIDVWAIKWWWSVFNHQGLCLYPNQSLLYNIGFDSLSTNTKGADTFYNDQNWNPDLTVPLLPEHILADQENYVRLQHYISQNYGSFQARAKRQLSKFSNEFLNRLRSV